MLLIYNMLQYSNMILLQHIPSQQHDMITSCSSVTVYPILSAWLYMTATYLITTECMPTTTSSIVVNSTSKYILFLNHAPLNTQVNMLQYALHHCNIAHSCNMQQYVESQQSTSSLQHTPLLRIILPRHAVFILNHFRMHPRQYMLHQHMLNYAMLCLFNIHQAQITQKTYINY